MPILTSSEPGDAHRQARIRGSLVASQLDVMRDYQRALDDIIHPERSLGPSRATATSTVRSVERTGDRVGVTFWDLAARYWVKPGNEALVGKLRDAQSTGRTARIVFDPKTLEVTHVG